GADRGTLEGHKGSIRASVFLPSALNPDSPQLATAGEDGTLRIWNAPKSSPPLTGHSMPIASGKISGDGVSAVTVSGDQTLRYWNLADGKQTWASPALGQPLHRVAISPSDDQLATGDAIGAIRLHNAKDGAVEFTHGAHSLAVTGLAYGPEAKRLVTSGLDGLVKLWTLPFVAPHTFPEYVNGATNLTFVAQNQLAVAAPDGTIHIGEKSIKIDEAATSIAISPDGKLIAVGTGTGKVKVRVIATGAEAFQLTGHQGSVNAVMFHPKEAKIATAAADGSIGLWTIPAEVPENPIDEPLLVWQAHAGGVTCLTFTPDGTSLVSGGGDFSIRYWNSIDGVAIRAMTHGAAVTALSLVNKGTQVISASADKTVRIWNLSNGSQVTSIAMPTAIQRMTVNSDATRVATSGDDNIIRLWELASGRELEWFAGHTAAIQALDFSNDDKTLVSAAGDKTVRKWTIGIERLIVADAAKIHTLTLSPDGKQIVTGGEDKLVKQWDFEGKLVRQFAGAAAPVRCVSIRADGTQLAAGGDPTSAQANLIIWNFANGQSLRTVPTGAGITALAFNGNGKIAVAGADKHLRVYSPDDEQLLQDWTAPNVLTDIAIGPDHTTILTGCADNNSHQFHYSLVELLTGHVGAATGIAFTTDGKRVVSCGVDKTVRLWNREDGKQLCRFVGHSAPIHSLALSGDGKKLVTAGDDKIVRVWDMPANDAQPAAQIQPTSALTHTVIVRSVSITADGQVVATAGDDVFIRLWDVATGKEREQLTGHTAAIHTVRLSADGSTVVSGGADNFARQFFPSVLAQVTADETAGGKAQLRSVAFASDGATLFTSGMENAARQWKFNRPLKVEVEPDPATDPATAKAASPAAEAAEAAPDEAAADELAAEAKPLPRLQLEPALVFNGATTALTHVATSGNGRFLLTASGDAHLRIHDVAAGAVLATLKVPAAITSIAISKDGLKIVTGAADKIIRNYELAAVNDGWELKLFHESLGHTEAVVDVALAADTSSMVSVAADSTIQRWIAASAHPRQTFSGHSGPIYGLSWRADGLLLASGSGDKTVRVWNTQTSKLSFICEGHTGQVNGVDFHPSGTDVVSCSNDGTIRIWSAKLPPDPPVDPAATAVAAPKVVADPAAPPEPAPGDQIAIIEDDIDDALLGVAYSRDGNFLMSGGASKVWRQWNRGGEMPLQLQRDFAIHNYPIYRVVPSPNNSRFTTFDSSGKLFIWTVSNGALAFHQQLPTTTGYGIAYSPNSEEMVVATRDHRVMRIIIPPTAR
ncbi:MAG: WD40 repeat protein/aspartate 1-decarboxylase, partial [Pirellulaceae bacterium]